MTVKKKATASRARQPNNAMLLALGYRVWAHMQTLLRVMLLLLLTPPAVAASSTCYSIKDADRKNLCLATSTNQQSHCYSIKDNDSKNMCLARLTLQKSHCYSIKAKDTKSECLALFR